MPKTSRLLAFSAAAMVALPGVCLADNYIRFSYSMADYEEQDLEFVTADQPDLLYMIDGYDPGKADYFGIAGGTWLNSNLRAELALDVSAASKEEDSATFSIPGSSAPADFEAKTTSHLLMLNGYYHFLESRSAGALDPYVGLGIGASDNELEALKVTVAGGNFATISDGDSTDFAYKAGAGLAYWLSDEAAIDFSIFYVDAGTVEGGDLALDGGTQAFPLSETVEMDLQSINYSLSVTFAL